MIQKPLRDTSHCRFVIEDKDEGHIVATSNQKFSLDNHFYKSAIISMRCGISLSWVSHK